MIRLFCSPGKSVSVCEEYIASWLSPFPFPAPNLTPYVGVQAVPPSSSVRLTPGKRQEVTKYWDFDPGSRISYRTDGEYEEHFRCSFATAVQRRLRADRPIVAELSGGMDSSSIVSIADLLIARARERPNKASSQYCWRQSYASARHHLLVLRV